MVSELLSDKITQQLLYKLQLWNWYR